MNIGEILRTARQEKKATIVDVADATRVSKKYIQALEDNNFNVIPSLVFAKGFLKAYCEYLGVDKKSLLDELASYYRGKEVQGKALSPTVRSVENKDAAKNRQMLTIYGFLGILLIAIVMFEYYSLVPSRKQRPVETSAAPIVTKEAITLNPVPVPVKQPVNKGIVVIKLTAVMPSTVMVEVDGKVVRDGEMEKGENAVFSGGFIRVRTGKGSGVRLFRDGRDYGIMGNESAMVEHSYMAR